MARNLGIAATMMATGGCATPFAPEPVEPWHVANERYRVEITGVAIRDEGFGRCTASVALGDVEPEAPNPQTADPAAADDILTRIADRLDAARDCAPARLHVFHAHRLYGSDCARNNGFRRSASGRWTPDCQGKWL